MIVITLSLDSMLAPVKTQGNLKEMVWGVNEIFTEFDRVMLLTQDVEIFTDPSTGIEHVPCAFSRSNIMRKILLRFTYLRWIYFYFYSCFWMLRHRKEISLLVSINVDSPAVLFSMLFGFPYVVYYHYDTAYQVRHVNRSFLVGALLLVIERIAFRKASTVWVTSPNLMPKAKSFGAKKVRVIPNWVDFNEVEGIRVPKKRSTGSRILFAGRLHRVKQVDLLIRAFHLIHETDSNANLYILGDGQQQQNLVKLAKDLGLSNSIHFMGFVSLRTVFKNMRQSDVLVLPSKMEGNPRVLIQAMVHKLPIVATNVPGIREMIQHMKTGYLIDKQQPEELAHAIEYVLKNKEDSTNMAERAYVYAQQNFSKQNVSQKIRDEVGLLLRTGKKR
jgi:glycosyltransferase involved in cell wall biosynthesis